MRTILLDHCSSYWAMWWKLPSPSTFLPALCAARDRLGLVSCCASSLCLLCTHLSFQSPTCARKSLLPRQLLDMHCSHSRFPRPFPVREIPTCLFTLVARLQTYPVLNWYGVTNQRELGAAQSSVAFSTHFVENCRTSGVQRPFICPSLGCPGITNDALTIWSSVFSICLQEVFLAPSLPCLPSLRLRLVLCSPYFWCYFFVFFMVPTALDLSRAPQTVLLFLAR